MRNVPYSLQYESLLLTRHANVLSRAASGQEAPLDRSAWVLLTRLEQDGPLSIREMRDALGLDDSTLNRQTASIVRSGLADRIRDPEGGIARKFQVTDLGRRRLESDRDNAGATLSIVLGGWSDTEVAALISWLRRYNEAFEEYDDRPWHHSAD